MIKILHVAALIGISAVLTGCGVKKNESPKDLAMAIFSSTSESDFSEYCALNGNNAEELIPMVSEDERKSLQRKIDKGRFEKDNKVEWRRTSKELEKYGVDGNAEILSCNVHTESNDLIIYGVVKQGEATYKFKIKKCMNLPESGWRTADDLDIDQI